MAIKTLNLLFDLDGTLIDISWRHYYTYKDIITKLKGKPLNKDMYWEMKRSKASVQTILKQSYLSPELSTIYLDTFKKNIELSKYLVFDKLFNFTLGTLGELMKNYVLQLTSSRRNISNALREINSFNLSKYFSRIDIGLKKDYKEPIIAVIGDTEENIILARRIHASAIAVLSGIRNINYLKHYNPDYIISSIKELKNVIKNELSSR